MLRVQSIFTISVQITILCTHSTDQKTRPIKCSCHACKINNDYAQTQKIKSSLGLINKKYDLTSSSKMLKRLFSRMITFIHYCFYRTVLLGVGWALFAYICYQIANTTVDYQIWDPYQVLGLSEV